MAQLVEQDFDQTVPKAGESGSQFLERIQNRAREEGLALGRKPISLELKKPKPWEDRQVLQAKFGLGSYLTKKGSTMRLNVYADQMGSSLQVGWQLTTGRNLKNSTGHRVANQVDSKPDNVRQINGFLSLFHESVFLPTLEELAESVQADASGRSSSGFFGA